MIGHPFLLSRGTNGCPLTGNAPGFDDGVETFPVDVREDGVYVGVEVEASHVRTVSDVMVEPMVNWGIKDVFGIVGHSNLGLADALGDTETRGWIRRRIALDWARAERGRERPDTAA